MVRDSSSKITLMAGKPWSLTTWISPYGGCIIWHLTSPGEKDPGESKIGDLRRQRLLFHLILQMTSHHRCPILLARNKPLHLPHTEISWTAHERQEEEVIMGCHCSDSCPQKCKEGWVEFSWQRRHAFHFHLWGGDREQFNKKCYHLALWVSHFMFQE